MWKSMLIRRKLNKMNFSFLTKGNNNTLEMSRSDASHLSLTPRVVEMKDDPLNSPPGSCFPTGNRKSRDMEIIPYINILETYRLMVQIDRQSGKTCNLCEYKLSPMFGYEIPIKFTEQTLYAKVFNYFDGKTQTTIFPEDKKEMVIIKIKSPIIKDEEPIKFSKKCSTCTILISSDKTMCSKCSTMRNECEFCHRNTNIYYI